MGRLGLRLVMKTNLPETPKDLAQKGPQKLKAFGQKGAQWAKSCDMAPGLCYWTVALLSAIGCTAQGTTDGLNEWADRPLLTHCCPRVAVCWHPWSHLHVLHWVVLCAVRVVLYTSWTYSRGPLCALPFTAVRRCWDLADALHLLHHVPVFHEPWLTCCPSPAVCRCWWTR